MGNDPKTARHHEVALRQCAIFAEDAGSNIAKAMIDAADYLATLTRPVAEHGELETALRTGHPPVDYVTRESAERVIAGKEAEIARLRDILDITERNELREAENNAALTARIEELEGSEQATFEIAARLLKEKEALEAKLAAANKAAFDNGTELCRMRSRAEALQARLAEMREGLKPFAKVAKYDIGDEERDEDIFRPMLSSLAVAPIIRVGDLRRARALLNKEGKS